MRPERARLAAAPVVHLLSPPYVALSHPIELDRIDCASVPGGALTILRLAQAEEVPRLLHTWLPAARRRHPWCTFVLQLPDYQADETPNALLLAGRSGIRACVLGDVISEPQLRRRLGDPTDFDERMVDWLAFATPHGAGMVPDLARSLLEQPCSGGSRRAKLHALGLPSPVRWRQFSRTLRALLRLQMNSRLSVEAAALDSGFADHASLWRLTRALFGITPSALRGTLGWEWLADRWLQRFSRR